MDKSVAAVCLLFGLWSVSTATRAADMKFHGTLNAPPPCTINNGNQVDVDFGATVGINNINGVNYLKPVNYTITCEKGAPDSSVMLTFSGTATDFDTSAVQTNVTGLGIRVLESGSPVTFDKPVPVNPVSPPVLQAVPVKAENAALKEGDFEATATLRADYQ